MKPKLSSLTHKLPLITTNPNQLEFIYGTKTRVAHLSVVYLSYRAGQEKENLLANNKTTFSVHVPVVGDMRRGPAPVSIVERARTLTSPSFRRRRRRRFWHSGLAFSRAIPEGCSATQRPSLGFAVFL